MVDLTMRRQVGMTKHRGRATKDHEQEQDKGRQAGRYHKQRQDHSKNGKLLLEVTHQLLSSSA